jgi:hypothetical protein
MQTVGKAYGLLMRGMVQGSAQMMRTLGKRKWHSEILVSKISCVGSSGCGLL